MGGGTDVALETERCLIRDWRSEDVERVLDIYSRWDVARWLGSAPRVMESLKQAEDAVAHWSGVNASDGWSGFWAVERKSDGVVAGAVLLVPLPDGDGEVEVGWHFHPDSWGQGLATESARAVVTWGFENGLDEILAVVRPGNDPSMAVCRHLGMAHMGRTSAYYGSELELFRLTP